MWLLLNSTVVLRLFSSCGEREIDTIFSCVLLDACALENRMSQGEWQLQRQI